MVLLKNSVWKFYKPIKRESRLDIKKESVENQQTLFYKLEIPSNY